MGSEPVLQRLRRDDDDFWQALGEPAGRALDATAALTGVAELT